MDGGRALRAGGKLDVANGAFITGSPREPRTASTLAGCPVRVCCHVSGFAATVDGVRAIRAGGKVDVANGALITHAPREPRTASTLAGYLVRVCRHVSGFVAAVDGGRALRAVRVVNVAKGAIITHAPRVPRTASTLARCLGSICCHATGFAAAMRGIRTLRARGVGDVADSADVACGASETRVACALACRVTAVRGHVRGLPVAVGSVRALYGKR